MVVAPIASARIPYDPLRDFDAIYRLATIANAFVVHPSLPVSSLKVRAPADDDQRFRLIATSHSN